MRGVQVGEQCGSADKGGVVWHRGQTDAGPVGTTAPQLVDGYQPPTRPPPSSAAAKATPEVVGSMV